MNLLVVVMLAAVAAPRGEDGRLFAMTNEARAGVGLAPLTWDEGLAEIAGGHAADMTSRRWSGHASSDGATLVDRVVRADLRLARVAENVGEAPDVDSAHEALMESPGHRANILDPELSIAGFAVLRDGSGRAYVVEDFGVPAPTFPRNEAAHEVLGLTVPAWAPRPDPELSSQLERMAQRMAETDVVTPDADAVDACWMLAYAAADPREIPPSREPGCTGRFGGAGVAWARTPTRPLGAFFVAIALRK